MEGASGDPFFMKEEIKEDHHKNLPNITTNKNSRGDSRDIDIEMQELHRWPT